MLRQETGSTLLSTITIRKLSSDTVAGYSRSIQEFSHQTRPQPKKILYRKPLGKAKRSIL